MAAVLTVTQVRVRDGKAEAAMAALAQLKGIIERLGGRYRVVVQLFGPAPTTYTVVTEVSSWAEYGAFAAKAEADPEYQAFLASARSTPWGDIIVRGLSTEVAI